MAVLRDPYEVRLKPESISALVPILLFYETGEGWALALCVLAKETRMGKDF